MHLEQMWNDPSQRFLFDLSNVGTPLFPIWPFQYCCANIRLQSIWQQLCCMLYYNVQSLVRFLPVSNTNQLGLQASSHIREKDKWWISMLFQKMWLMSQFDAGLQEGPISEIYTSILYCILNQTTKKKIFFFLISVIWTQHAWKHQHSSMLR